MLPDFFFYPLFLFPIHHPILMIQKKIFTRKISFVKWFVPNGEVFVTFLYKFSADAVFLTSEDAVFCVKDICVKFQIPESFVF